MADRSLKKGAHTVDFQYTNNCDSINAIDTRVAIDEGKMILKFTLKPAGGNQSDDEENLHTDKPVSVQIRDEQVGTKLRNFQTARLKDLTAGKMVLEVTSRNKVLSFEVKRIKRGQLSGLDLTL
ncbi:MAG TPA: hypothetical protein VGN44_11120 [Candidatus Angelobacter sp.]|jgi:hypothetical protein